VNEWVFRHTTKWRSNAGHRDWNHEHGCKNENGERGGKHLTNDCHFNKICYFWIEYFESEYVNIKNDNIILK
jgi:hypothetical protein